MRPALFGKKNYDYGQLVSSGALTLMPPKLSLSVNR